jgi:GH18 family chitinase
LKAIIGFCQKNQFDGVDLDWEHPANASEEKDYATLLVELKKGLAPHQLEASVAVAGWQGLSAEALGAVDRIHLMAYDARGRHSTPAFAEADVARLIQRGAPPDKICLGVPFYGRGITNAEKALSYAQLVQKYHPAPEIDEVDGIYFNGIKTIERKTRYALENKLGGIMIWEMGQDTNDEQSLLRAIRRVARP